MASLTMAISRLVLAFALLQVIAGETSYPLFAWTPSAGSLDGIEPNSAAELLQAKHSAFKGSVVFMHSLSTEELAANRLTTKQMQQSIDSAAASLFRPLASSPTDASELSAAVGRSQQVSAESALDFLEANPAFFEGPDHPVLMVDMREMESSVDSLTAADALRSKILSHKAVPAEVLQVLSTIKATAARKLLWTDTYNSAATGEAVWSFYPRPTGGMTTLHPNGLLGLGMTFYLIFIAFCGFCCMFQLQTPDMFEGDQKEEMNRALGKNAQ